MATAYRCVRKTKPERADFGRRWPFSSQAAEKNTLVYCFGPEELLTAVEKQCTT